MSADDPRDPLDDPAVGPEADVRSNRLLSRLARRLGNPRELGGDAMELMGVLLESSDRAKTEMVRMLAREVRTYLEELKLKEDLRELITGHSLEVNLSLSLKPLADRLDPAPEPDADAPHDEASPPASKKPAGKPPRP